MTQEEYSAENAQINAEHKKRMLHLQQAIQARKDQIQDLTSRYLEEKASLEKALQKLKVEMAEATAKAADRKADLNNRYLKSLKERPFWPK